MAVFRKPNTVALFFNETFEKCTSEPIISQELIDTKVGIYPTNK